MLTATFEYHGFADYWSGNGRRWDDNAGCLFAYYGPHTTVRDIINGLVCDFENGGDCESFPADISSEDVRSALLATLTDEGRKDYESEALCEYAAEYADVNGTDEGEMDESPVVIVLLQYTPDAE